MQQLKVNSRQHSHHQDTTTGGGSKPNQDQLDDIYEYLARAVKKFTVVHCLDLRTSHPELVWFDTRCGLHLHG